MGHNAANLGRLQIDDHDHVLADKVSRLIMLGNAGHDFALFIAQIHREFQEFFRLGHGFSCENLDHPQVNLGKIVNADFCIISKREGDFDWFTLTEDPFVAIVSSDHQLTKKGSVSGEDLSHEPFIMMHPDVASDCSIYLENNGIIPDIRFSCSDTLAAYHLVEAGLGITLDNMIYTPQFNGKVTALPLDPPYTIPLGIAVPRAGQRSPAVRRFIELSQTYFDYSI